MNARYLVLAFVSLLVLSTVSAEEANGTAKCVEDWTCTEWSECVNGYQNRTCTDISFCMTDVYKLPESKKCTSPEPTVPLKSEPAAKLAEEPQSCAESWNCGPWSSCSDGTQTRKCADENMCDTQLKKPAEKQDCEAEPAAAAQETPAAPTDETPSSSLGFYLLLLGSLILIGGAAALYIYKHQSAGPAAPVRRVRPGIDPVFSYVTMMRMRGYDNESIRRQMESAGYDKEVIQRYLPIQDPRLKQFTKQLLSQGYNPDQIEDHLLRYGYDLDTVKDHVLR